MCRCLTFICNRNIYTIKQKNNSNSFCSIPTQTNPSSKSGENKNNNNHDGYDGNDQRDSTPQISVQ